MVNYQVWNAICLLAYIAYSPGRLMTFRCERSFFYFTGISIPRWVEKGSECSYNVYGTIAYRW